MHTLDPNKLQEDDEGNRGNNNENNNNYENEETPLLSHRASADEATSSEQRLSIPKIIALTCINGGLQVFFSTIMANLAPYLQSLHLSKSSTAAIIISIPLSGAFIGPLIGALSDRLRTRFGRRRPIILLGAISTVFLLLLLAWTQEVIHFLLPNHNHENDGMKTIMKITAILLTFALSISIQPVQACTRALMVDIAPPEEQSRVSAYASRIQGASAIGSFFASSLSLNRFLPRGWGWTQFQCLAVLNALTLGGTVGVTCVFVGEEDGRRRRRTDGGEGRKGEFLRGVVEFFRRLWWTVKDLPEKIAQACKVQVASWMAWFPFLFYNTTYIGELVNVAAEKASRGAATKGEGGEENDQLAQAGSIASLCFASVGFFFVLLLPAILPFLSRIFRRQQSHSPNHQSLLRPTAASENDLIYLWLLTQPLLGILLLLTLFVNHQWQGTILIALGGLPWSVTQWVPWAVIGFETAKLGVANTSTNHCHNHNHNHEEEEEEGGTNDDTWNNQSGAILGVHNIAISLPQVISGLVSSVTYRIAEGAGSEVPTAWVLASSGFAAFGAAILAGRMVERG